MMAFLQDHNISSRQKFSQGSCLSILVWIVNFASNVDQFIMWYLHIGGEWRIYASASWPNTVSNHNLSSVQYQTIIWTKDCILRTGCLWTNCYEIWTYIQRFSVKNIEFNYISTQLLNILSYTNAFISNRVRRENMYIHIAIAWLLPASYNNFSLPILSNWVDVNITYLCMVYSSCITLKWPIVRYRCHH